MKKIKYTLSLLLTAVILLTNSASAFASTQHPSTISTEESSSSVVVTDAGVFIQGIYYSQEDFSALLESAIQLESIQKIGTVQTQSAAVGALVAGTWYIPGVGEVIITAAGVILVAGVVIEVGSWLYDTISDWFATRAEISEAKAKIPERLKDKSGEVDLGNFDQKVNGKTAYKEKGGWIIEKDTAGHKGSKWKLKNKSGDRIASLDENGKVLGK